MIRAKFTCNSITKRKGWSGTSDFLYDYSFSVVTSGSEENKKFYGSTPGGEIKLTAVGAELFEPGKEYYLDFNIAE